MENGGIETTKRRYIKKENWMWMWVDFNCHNIPYIQVTDLVYSNQLCIVQLQQFGWNVYCCASVKFHVGGDMDRETDERNKGGNKNNQREGARERQKQTGWSA